MLKQVLDPKRRGVELTPTHSPVLTTKSGAKVTNFAGNDGNEYEQAKWPNGVTKWYLVGDIAD